MPTSYNSHKMASINLGQPSAQDKLKRFLNSSDSDDQLLARL